MSAKVVACNCKHEFQDEHYGKGKRLANLTGKGEYRCTVCGTLHRGPSEQPAKKGGKK
jgi:rubrerythrin